jgi:hypothetical protein
MTTGHRSASRVYDQIVCTHCGKAWDVNDPEPPECTAPTVPTKRKPRRGGTVWISELKDKIKNA